MLLDPPLGVGHNTSHRANRGDVSTDNRPQGSRSTPASTRADTGTSGLSQWQIRVAEYLSLTPHETDPHNVPVDVVLRFDRCNERIRSTVGEIPPLGASRAAKYLSDLLGFAVDRRDLIVLALRGQLQPAGMYLGRPVFLVKQLVEYAARTTGARITATLTGGQAADGLDAARPVRRRHPPKVTDNR